MPSVFNCALIYSLKLIKIQAKFVSRCLCVWILLLFTAYPLQIIAAPLSSEYKLKAALIYKLLRFVEWPQVYGSKANNDFGLCVLGRDDFGSALDALKGRKVGKIATISVFRFKQSESIKSDCQLVFISDSKQAFLTPIVNSMLQYPILTIGDGPDFAKTGGMIQLVHGEKRIGFTINLQQVKASGLRISAPLLELSTIVTSDK
jgi:hypothetical protein